MIKTSLADWESYQTSFKRSFKSKWSLLLILFPLALYIASRIWEGNIASALLNFFPRELHKSVGFYRDMVQLISSEMLWLTGFFLLTWIFVVYVPLFQTAMGIVRGPLPGRSAAYAVIALTFIASILVSNNTLERFPNSSDEYVYVYQAESLSQGKLWERDFDHHEFFKFNNMAHKDGIRLGRFPPGWPLVLSVAYVVGLPPFLVNPILGLITLIVFYSFARRVYDERVAWWALVTMAFSSYFIFNAASFFSHSSCMLATLLFVYFLYLYFDDRKVMYPILAGLFLGLVIIIRYYTAVLIFLPFSLLMLYRYRLKAIPMFFLIGVGCLPGIAFLFWYNYSITGNALHPVTMWAYDDEALGFVNGHTPMKGLEHVIRWGFMFLYWCSPALMILYLVYGWRKIKHAAERISHPEDYAFILLVAGYFFYYQIGGNQYGPRFFFEAFPFLVLFVVRNVLQYRERWTMALLCAGLLYAVIRFPFITAREHRVIEERKDLYKVVEKARVHNAVVYVTTSTGIIRPMPTGDLIRNSNLYNDVIYALEVKGKENILFNEYPDRSFYKYVRDPNQVEGRLVPVYRENQLAIGSRQ